MAAADSMVNRNTASASSPLATILLCTSAECRNRLCGMMTQPTMPTTCLTAEGGIRGTRRPSRTAPWSGLIFTNSPPIVAASTAMSAPKKSSSGRVPRRSRYRKPKAVAAVTTTPVASGMPKRIKRPMLQPTTSWMSEPMMASSVMHQSSTRMTGGYRSRQCSARCRREAHPSLAATICMQRPMKVAPSSAHSSMYPNWAPHCRSASRFPGST
mmetsp:Transcript_78466/g.222452  ORF Transcript_78466/g.222452 Transcript_78466/m.222452 type:complete len:213 (+) Transcript_78466:782-1420(+)